MNIYALYVLQQLTLSKMDPLASNIENHQRIVDFISSGDPRYFGYRDEKANVYYFGIIGAARLTMLAKINLRLVRSEAFINHNAREGVIAQIENGGYDEHKVWVV